MATETDDLFAALEQEDDIADYRAQRLQELQSELASQQQKQQPQSEHAQETPQNQTVTTLLNNTIIPTLNNDQSVLDFTTQITDCVVHFFHPDFSRCETMDKHLSTLANAHHDTGAGSDGGAGVRFARVDVRDIPFVVEKLKIRVLPCLLGFDDGVVVERVVGFEGLGLGGGNPENQFETSQLEDRLVKSGVLNAKRVEDRPDRDDDSGDEDEDSEEEKDPYARGKTIRSGSPARWKKQNYDDDDDDWD